MTETAGEMHPCPQLARERWTDLSGPWNFAYDDMDRGLDERWPERAADFVRTIEVPFPPESPASGIGETGYHPIVWYRRLFRDVRRDPGERLLLHCGAVDYRAHVWVNGRLVATHEGGHTPFGADITNALQPDGEQVLVVRAEDAPDDLAQPRGKQDWLEQPHKIWYHRTTGIWQPVWLEPVAATHITGLRWTPDIDRGTLGFEATLRRHDAASLCARVQLRLHGALLADDVYTVEGTTSRRGIDLSPALQRLGTDQVLWSPEHPNLVDATITLLDGDEIVDEVHSYAGLRGVSAADGRFLLNGRPYYLRLALEQGYWPESHLATPSAEALRHEVELAKELGFNGVRVHQKVEDPRFLYWCDRLGLLVWGEMANAYIFTAEAIERLTREWIAVLARDYSHPCIVAWVPLNESWGVPNLARDPTQRQYIQALYCLTKALDPTRLTMSNEGWEHVAGDILGIHDYTFDGAELRRRYGSAEAVERTLRDEQPGRRALTLPPYHHADEPVMMTEFGGLSYRPAAGTPWFGYGTVGSAEEFLAKYRELIDAILDSPALAGFCYTQLTDTEQETNGLLTADRVPKLDANAIRLITSRAITGEP